MGEVSFVPGIMHRGSRLLPLLLASLTVGPHAWAEALSEAQAELRDAPPEPGTTPSNSGTRESDSPESDSPAPQAPEAPAPVTPADPAREAYQRGDRLYFEGDYSGALAAFEESYALSGRIEMLFNLANAHERLGHYAEANMALRGYIPHATPEARGALEKRAQRLDQLAKQQRETGQVSANQPEDGPSIPVSRAIGFGLSGLGAIGLGLGIGFGVAALDQREKLDELCTSGASGRLCPPEAEPILEKDSTFSTVADISFVVGTVAAVAGVVLIIDAHPKSGAAKGREVTARIGPSSFTLQGTF